MGWVGVCGQNICYHAAAFHYSLEFDMHHDHVLKKDEFRPTDTVPRDRGGGFCGQNNCYHVAVFVILFNLICNMTVF